MQLILLIFTVLLFFIYSSLLIYYRISWNKIPVFSTSSPNPQPTTQISVIIPARNEAANIQDCLKSIRGQLYPGHLFEVLVVDDHSTDSTASIVKSFYAKNIRLMSLKNYIGDDQINSYKKKAIEMGIQQSTGKLIVTTDADCFVPKNWLQTIASFYEKYEPAFIAAPVAINCNSNFLQKFQALDFMTLQGITGAAVHKKLYSMCNGANLAYEKSAFYEVNGFNGIDAVASGDDMLLMHKIYKRYPQRIMFLKSNDAIVQTKPVENLSAFFNQRVRWASKADKYDDKRIFPVLLLVYFFNLMLLILPIMGFFHNPQYSILNIQYSLLTAWIVLLLLKTIADLFFLFPVAFFFNKQRMLWIFPVMQPFHILYTVVAGWLGKFGSYKWKERKVK